MKRFAALYRRLDGITGNLARLAALRDAVPAAARHGPILRKTPAS